MHPNLAKALVTAQAPPKMVKATLPLRWWAAVWLAVRGSLKS